MGEHTPGEWFAGKLRLDGNGISRSLTIGTYGADEHFEDTICEVWDGNHDAKANAHLIITAAALLAKCEKIVAWLDRLANHAEANVAKNDRFPALREAEIADAKNYRASAKDIRTVIAKARGETP